MFKSRAFRIVKNIIWYTVVVIFGLICLLVAWLAVDKFIFKSPVPSVFGYAYLSVDTGSMSGSIEEGDMIIIKDTGDYEVGDVITFLQKGDSVPTTHRIVYVNSDGEFLTRGDANNANDTLPVSADMIYGEVVRVLSGGGTFAEWIIDDGWIYIAALLLIFGIGTMLVKSFSEPDTSEDENSESTENTGSGENGEEK